MCVLRTNQSRTVIQQNPWSLSRFHHQPSFYRVSVSRCNGDDPATTHASIEKGCFLLHISNTIVQCSSYIFITEYFLPSISHNGEKISTSLCISTSVISSFMMHGMHPTGLQPIDLIVRERVGQINAHSLLVHHEYQKLPVQQYQHSPQNGYVFD